LLLLLLLLLILTANNHHIRPGVLERLKKRPLYRGKQRFYIIIVTHAFKVNHESAKVCLHFLGCERLRIHVVKLRLLTEGCGDRMPNVQCLVRVWLLNASLAGEREFAFISPFNGRRCGPNHCIRRR